MKSDSAYSRARLGRVIAETPVPRVREMEIQARLFNGDYGFEWITTCGEKFRVHHFGEWNREAGPDFKNARIEFENRGIEEGDIEVDWENRDWENHGHAVNPAYANTRLHFFVSAGDQDSFARSSDNRLIPQARLLVENPTPPAVRSEPFSVTLEQGRAMIDRAARFRLENKHAAWVSASRLHGEDAALFFAISAGLGYKNNAIPFLLAAQRTGWKTVRGSDGEAMLFGISGFLEPRSFDDADDITKTYLKPLWDAWWKVRDNFSRGVLPRQIWKFSGLRPPNHPHRRLGALSATACNFPLLRKNLSESGEKGFLRFFEELDHPYWTRHWNLSADPLAKPVALVGTDRARDLLLNAHLPTLHPDSAEKILRATRAPQPSGVLERASRWLLGTDSNAFLRISWDQQGLLQLYRDFGAVSPVEAWDKIRSA